MKAPLSGPLVAARAKTLLVTACAVQTAGGGNRPMDESEVGRMNAHDTPAQRIRSRDERHRRWSELNARRLSRLAARKRVDRASTERACVARATARLRVTRRTGLNTDLRERAMRVREV